MSEQMVTLHVWTISMLTAKKVKENQEEWSSTCLEPPFIKKICYHWAKRLQYNTKHAWYSKVCITRRINWPCSKLFTISTLVNTCEYLQILGWSKSTSISVSTWLFTGTWPVGASTCIQLRTNKARLFCGYECSYLGQDRNTPGGSEMLENLYLKYIEEIGMSWLA